MHIVEIPSFFPPYGGEFCLEQSRALQARGHEVRVVSNVQLSVKRSIREFLTLPYGKRWTEQQGIAVLQSYQRGVPKVVRPNVERWVTIVRSLFRDYVARYGKPDVLHAHCAKWAGYAAMLIGEEYGLPYIVTEHLPSMIYAKEFGPIPGDAWQIPLLRHALEQASRVILVSDELKSDLAPYFGTSYRSVAISNLIDVDFFAYRSRMHSPSSHFRFCCLAINDWRKGYDVLFNAFNQVAEVLPYVELHIAGAGTDERPFFDEFAALPCCGKVRTYGQLDKERIRRLLYNSDALVLATRSESQGLVLLEALSTGIPAISTEAIPKSVRIDCFSWFVPVIHICNWNG